MKTLERMEYISKMNMQTSHAALVYQIKKSRGINWTPSEKVSKLLQVLHFFVSLSCIKLISIQRMFTLILYRI